MAAATFDLSGRSILITGAGRGLGRALALGAVQAGASVSAFDLDAASLAELRAASPAISTQVVDVVDRAAFMRAAERIGRLDAVVNNAMLIRYDPIEAVDEEILDRMLSIGIKGSIWGVQALLRHMDPARGGVVLNLASPTGERGFPNTAVYSPGQGRDRDADQDAGGGAGTPPGPSQRAGTGVDSDSRRGGDHAAGRYERRAIRIPPRRLGREEDATLASLYLLSDAASFVSGETLHVDGGFLASA